MDLLLAVLVTSAPALIVKFVHQDSIPCRYGGYCVREGCPFLHTVLDDDSDMEEDFIMTEDEMNMMECFIMLDKDLGALEETGAM